MKKNPQSGVTLIEILVAVTLLSLLSVGMLMAMRLGFSTMDKVDARMMSNRRVVNARGIIESEIEGFVLTLAEYHPQPEMTVSLPFLQTEPQVMRFVTTYSLEDGWRGRPQIAVLQVIPGESAGVRLIVNETPYTGREQAGGNIAGIEQDQSSGRRIVHFTAVASGPKSFVLADRLAFCRFSYLEPLFQAPFQLWRPDWVQTQRLPQAIRIEMAPLDATPQGLHVTTVTAPVNVTRMPGVGYAD
ncbi:MAG TPA: prepilin-type N-terminal cleavage/methylation domain-containing protein [Bryobacteraceae bacterium]|jgi:prepilin-type N-terminal cleavage/methylation domain-containing protein|nr:prepilin-type N-terminal cleavage/methylation domain-containing protein [Bryobacteraceae bacterium]